jgi:hypothetical protein
MPTPYPVKFKLPLEFLTLQDWNNFVNNLLFINQYGPGKLLQYYQNGNFQNLDEVIAKYLYVSALKVAGYNVLHNLSEPQAYTFGEGKQQPFKTMSNRPTINFPYSILVKFVEFYPISKLPNYQFLVFPIEKIQAQLSQVSKQLQLLIPNVISKIATPQFIAGTQFQFSGTATVQTLIEDYINPLYLQTWREIIIQNLGSSAVQINNSIYLMPKQCLKLTASSPSEVQLTAQTPTLLSEEIEFVGIIGTPITTYTITLTNNQADPTPSPFQQLLNLNLSSLLSNPNQFSNLEFCLDVQCNTPLYAYVENYSSDLSTVYIWINLPTSIPANGSLTIYMFIRNSSQYPYTGVSPLVAQQLSLTGNYDNGANVFPYYQSFANLTALPSSWGLVYNSASSSLTFETYYLDITSANANNGITQSSSSNFENLVIDFLVQLNSFSGTGGSIIGIGLGEANTTSTYFIGGGGGAVIGNNSNGVAFGYNNNGTTNTLYEYVGTSNVNNFSVPTSAVLLGIGLASSETYFYYNYQLQYSSTSIPGTFSLPITVIKQSQPTDMYLYTIKTRNLPPNGVMPSNTQPQKTIVLVA